ncbi:hypothetical protein PDK03_07500 [Bacillus cereus group sp. TH204-1LC]|uniref:hypothetical protein n=1 Tax=Bacillus cereus group sp. TH204-1LC TaxID=3018054 RepID=UPI0022E78501|nr:hypothetical protein [Bacillus cereus group sp. TH204-1LC]MDA1616441.1 hypothetical protein [Bacillus cereus group sp. TH204-1LC]
MSKWNKYKYTHGKTCSVCKEPITNNNQSGMCFPCVNKQRKINRDADVVSKWLETGETPFSVQSTIRGAIRDYIYQEQNHRCAICNIDNVWNGIVLNFILDHVDGDASNNSRENLRLVCPNCDSQLDTYKSKNKNSSRSHR